MKTNAQTEREKSDGFEELAKITLQGRQKRESDGIVRALATLMRRASEGSGSVSLKGLSIAPEDAARITELPEFFALDGDVLRLPRYANHAREVHSFFERHALCERRLFGDLEIQSALNSILPYAAERNQKGETIFENSHQRLAIAGLVDCRVGILTGGPGTGKTTTAAALLALLKRLSPGLESAQVIVTAPTGKAACRIAESIGNSISHLDGLSQDEQDFLRGIRAVTIHRALEWGPIPPEAGGPFQRGPSRPLEARFIIVDEASMVDLALMRSLVLAMHPDASLILLGDSDQLESVEVGGLLLELVQRAACASLSEQQRECLATRLGTNPETVNAQFRTGLPPRKSGLNRPLPGLAFGLQHSRRAMHAPWILKLADAVRPLSNAGYAAMKTCIEQNPERLSFIKDPSRSEIRGFLELRWQKWLKTSRSWQGLASSTPEQQREALELSRGFQLLCSTNAQVDEANLWGIRALAHGVQIKATEIPHGCPILIQKNSHALGLTNGDVGIALAQPGQALASVAIFDSPGGIPRIFPIAQLPGFSPAFGLTIHKSQGSEWREVAIELPEKSAAEMLTRNLLYTAITRASSTVHLLGSEEVLKTLVPD